MEGREPTQDERDPGQDGGNGGDPGASGGAGSAEQDPIFQKAEPQRRGERSTLLLWQFFLFPLLIVVAVVGILVLVGAFTGGTDTPEELLDTLRSGGANEAKQAGQQLAILIRNERRRADRAEEGDEPAFYSDTRFRLKLRDTLRTALGDVEGTPDRAEWISVATGLVQDIGAIPLLLEILYPRDPPPGQQAPEIPRPVRQGAARGLYYMDHPAATPALLRIASDPRDEAVRNLGISGLARPPAEGQAPQPQVVAALKRALEEEKGVLALTAAVGLAHRGDAAGASVIARGLDREELAEMGVVPGQMAAALRNAIRGAAALRAPELRAAVERLTQPESEGDGEVRALARIALESWS